MKPSFHNIQDVDLAVLKTWLAQAGRDDIGDVLKLREELRILQLKCRVGEKARVLSEAGIRIDRWIGFIIARGRQEGWLTEQYIHGRYGTKAATLSELFGMDQEHATKLSYWARRFAQGSDDQFEDLLAKCRADGRMIRVDIAAVLAGKMPPQRTLDMDELKRLAGEGHSSHQIARMMGVVQETITKKARQVNLVIRADRVLGRRRHLNQNRILEQFVATLESLLPSCDLIHPPSVDQRVLVESLGILKTSIRELRRLQRRLEE